MIRSSVFLIKSAYFTPDPLPPFPGTGDMENYSTTIALDIGQDIIYDKEHVTGLLDTINTNKSMEEFVSTPDPKEIFFRTTSVSAHH